MKSTRTKIACASSALESALGKIGRRYTEAPTLIILKPRLSQVKQKVLGKHIGPRVGESPQTNELQADKIALRTRLLHYNGNGQSLAVPQPITSLSHFGLLEQPGCELYVKYELRISEPILFPEYALELQRSQHADDVEGGNEKYSTCRSCSLTENRVVRHGIVP